MSLRLAKLGSLRAHARDLLAGLLHRAGVSDPRRLDSRTLLILTFHRVLPAELRAQYPLPGLAVTPEDLHWVITRLQPYFDVAPVSQAWQQLARGVGHGKPLMSLTFDDGQWDNLEFAAPVLSRCGVPATFYVPVEAVEKGELLWHDSFSLAWVRPGVSQEARLEWLGGSHLPADLAAEPVMSVLEHLKLMGSSERLDRVRAFCESTRAEPPGWVRLMTWGEVATLASRGHEIGSHSMSHRLLPQLSASEQLRELEESRAAIHARVGSDVQSICYPNGSHDQGTLELAAQAGYLCGVTTEWGLNRPSAPRHALRRCDMDVSRLVDRSGHRSDARLRMRLFVKGAVRRVNA